MVRVGRLAGMRRRNLYFGEMEGPEQEMRIGREAASLSTHFGVWAGSRMLKAVPNCIHAPGTAFIVGEYAGRCVRCRSAT